MAVTRQNLIDRLNLMNAASAANPIKKGDFVQFLLDWLNYMTNDGQYSAGVLEQWKTETLALQNAKLNADITLANNAAAQALASAAMASLVAQGQATANVNSKPVFLLDYLNTRLIDSRLTFSRADSDNIATYIGNNGFYKIAKKGKPRFQFDPTTKKQLGLLYEKNNRTNYCLYNRDFTQNVWSKGVGGTSVTLAQVKTPFGDTGYNKIVEGNNNGGHLFSQSIALISDSASCFSFYAKSLETETIRLEINAVSGANTNGLRVDLDIKNGTVINTQNIGTSAYLSTRVDIEVGPYGGFVFTIYTKPSLAGITTRGLLFYHLKNGSITYQGDSTSGYLLDIPQFEIGENRSSAIITQNSPVLRPADSLLIPNNLFEDFFPNASEEGTIMYAGQKVYEGAVYQSYYDMSGAATTNGVNKTKIMQGPTNDPYVESFVDGVSQFVANNTGGTTFNNIFSSVFAYKKNNAKFFLNNAFAGSSTTFTPPSVINFSLGNVSGIISYIAFWPKRISDAEALQLSNMASLFTIFSANQAPSNMHLKSAAYYGVNDILRTTGRQEFSIDCTGSSITRNIRRPYAFNFELVDSSGVSVTTQPSASCVENTDNSLVFTGPAGKTLTYAITPVFEY